MFHVSFPSWGFSHSSRNSPRCLTLFIPSKLIPGWHFSWSPIYVGTSQKGLPSLQLPLALSPCLTSVSLCMCAQWNNGTFHLQAMGLSGFLKRLWQIERGNKRMWRYWVSLVVNVPVRCVKRKCNCAFVLSLTAGWTEVLLLVSSGARRVIPVIHTTSNLSLVCVSISTLSVSLCLWTHIWKKNAGRVTSLWAPVAHESSS